MDVGVHNAGFHIAACVEKDRHCCETLRTNFERTKSQTKVLENDVREIDPEQLLHDLGLKPGQLDLLFGGPPCQSFSQIGKQEALGDERGLLIFQIARFAQVFQPKAILMEQVKGLLSARDTEGTKGGVMNLFLRDLESIDYIPKWRVINAADFGVPQLRNRLFIVATKGKNGYEFPFATHAPLDKNEMLFSLPAYSTVGDALKGLKEPSNKNGKPREDSHVDVTPDGDRYRIHGVPEGQYLAAQKHLPEKQRCRLTKKDTTKFLRVSRKRPSHTLRCGEIFFHPSQDRYLTPREYMRLHGYPDDYILKGPIRGRSGRVRDLDQHRQIANSVPPPVAEALAKNIIELLDAKDF